MVMWYWSADNLIWQVSIDHNMMSYIKKNKVNQGCTSLSTYYLEDGRHLVRLHRRHHRRCAYAPTSNTASHDNHEKINSWVSFSFLYEYGALLGVPAAGAPLQRFWNLNVLTQLEIVKSKSVCSMINILWSYWYSSEDFYSYIPFLDEKTCTTQFLIEQYGTCDVV